MPDCRLTISFNFADPKYRNQLKNLLRISLLFILLFNMAGYYYLFEFERGMARNEMLQGPAVGKGEVRVMTLINPATDPAYKRIGPTEFVYAGQMFDIVSEYRDGNRIVFHCRADHRETRLFAGYKTMNQRKIATVFNAFSSYFFSPRSLTLAEPEAVAGPGFQVHVLLPYSGPLGTASPPPERLS